MPKPIQPVKKILPQRFFDRPTATVAQDLLGKFLVRRYRGREWADMITDVEVYDGLRDKGSHAHRGETKRNTHMFGPAGHWYVYFTYGIHWMLNIVTREKGYPAAVLIRGLTRVNGPARLTKQFGITGKLNGLPAVPESGLWIEDRGAAIFKKETKKGPRIGIDYAGPFWKKRNLRFFVENTPAGYSPK